MRLPGELNCLYQGRRQEQQAEGSVPCEPKVPPLPWIWTPVPVKPTFPTQNLLCQPHCCAAARFSHLPANRHQTQRARSRFFYRKTTCSCLKVRFNTENCKNEKISLKNRNQVQKKVNTTATGEKWCTKASTQKKPFCTCKVARSQTPSLAFLLPPCFVGSIILTTSGAILKFSLCWHTIRFQNFQKFFKFSIAPVGITSLYIWVDTTYQDMYFLSKKLVLKIFKRFASISKMKVY